MVTKSAAFEQAIKDSRNLKAKPSNDELLQLYAFFKQGTQDPTFDKADKPGAFDLKGKAKYNAWKEVVEKDKTTPEDAQKKYVKLVGELKEKLGFDASAK